MVNVMGILRMAQDDATQRRIAPDPQMGSTASNESWLDGERRKIDEADEMGLDVSRLARSKKRRERIATAVLGHLAAAEMERSTSIPLPEVIQINVANAVRLADALIAELDKK